LKIRFLLLAAITLMSGCARAECPYPKAPEKMPDGYIATKAEMAQAQHAFTAFNDAITDYTACVDNEAEAKIAKGGKDLTPEQIKQINDEATQKHDAAVDDLEARVEQFNTEVRGYNELQKQK
jgi:hypothetical protein